MLEKVVWYALGRNGHYALDVMMVMLICGIIITYEGKTTMHRLLYYYTPLSSFRLSTILTQDAI
jgi:hypothetical protein